MGLKGLEVGQTFKTNRCGYLEVIENMGGGKYKVKFEDGYTTIAVNSAIKSGSIKNPYKASVEGIGYFGVGEYGTMASGKMTQEYSVWVGIIKRCYNKSFQKTSPQYVGCSVAEEWHNFQNFAKWYSSQNTTKEKKYYEVDKDLLFLGNKIYATDKCCLLPIAVNSLFAGSTSETVYRGVSWHKPSKKWVVQCHIDDGNSQRKSNQRYLGTYHCKEEASEVYWAAKTKHCMSVIDKYKEEIPEQVINNIQLLLKNKGYIKN